MNSIKYTGTEECFTCIGQSNKWTLYDHEELGLLIFFENTQKEPNSILLSSVIDNKVFFYEICGRMTVGYTKRADNIVERYEIINIEKTNEKITLSSERRKIEFTKI